MVSSTEYIHRLTIHLFSAARNCVGNCLIASARRRNLFHFSAAWTRKKRQQRHCGRPVTVICVFSQAYNVLDGWVIRKKAIVWRQRTFSIRNRGCRGCKSPGSRWLIILYSGSRTRHSLTRLWRLETCVFFSLEVIHTIGPSSDFSWQKSHRNFKFQSRRVYTEYKYLQSSTFITQNAFVIGRVREIVVTWAGLSVCGKCICVRWEKADKETFPSPFPLSCHNRNPRRHRINKEIGYFRSYHHRQEFKRALIAAKLESLVSRICPASEWRKIALKFIRVSRHECKISKRNLIT